MERRPLIGKMLAMGMVCLTLGVWIVGCGQNRRSTQAALTGIAVPTLTESPSPPPPTPSPTSSRVPTVTRTATPATKPITVPTLSPTPSPTSSPAPLEPSATLAAAGPMVRYFRANVEVADPGQVITLTWSTTCAESAIIYKLYYSGQLPAQGLDVPPSGSITYTIPIEDRNWVNLMLYVEDAAHRHSMATTAVQLRCPSSWFFTPQPEAICPTAPLISLAAEQHFEAGTMIWVEAEDAIYVLYQGEAVAAHWNRFEDTWDEDQPDRDPEITPPAGLQQPIRGFGLIWREQPGVREQLGWATGQEQGFTTVMQQTTRYKYNAWYLLALDGRIWYLGPERSSWDKLTPLSLTLKVDD